MKKEKRANVPFLLQEKFFHVSAMKHGPVILPEQISQSTDVAAGDYISHQPLPTAGLIHKVTCFSKYLLFMSWSLFSYLFYFPTLQLFCFMTSFMFFDNDNLHLHDNTLAACFSVINGAVYFISYYNTVRVAILVVKVVKTCYVYIYKVFLLLYNLEIM